MLIGRVLHPLHHGCLAHASRRMQQQVVSLKIGPAVFLLLLPIEEVFAVGHLSGQVPNAFFVRQIFCTNSILYLLDPLPLPNTVLSVEELDQAWKDARLFSSWSAQCLALSVLDATGKPMHPGEVVAFVEECTRWHGLTEASPKFKRRGCPIRVLVDGRWAIATDAGAAVAGARRMVRDRLETARRYAAMRPDPAVIEANRKAIERQRAAHQAKLAKMSRVA